MQINNNIFEKLNKSKFRSSFHLKQKDFDYISAKGLDKITVHARDFVDSRLTDTSKFVDSKQTPMHGHPVFIAQHATATCCRDCLYKWHHIEPTHILTAPEQEYIVSINMQWITNEINNKK